MIERHKFANRSLPRSVAFGCTAAADDKVFQHTERRNSKQGTSASLVVHTVPIYGGSFCEPSTDAVSSDIPARLRTPICHHQHCRTHLSALALSPRHGSGYTKVSLESESIQQYPPASTPLATVSWQHPQSNENHLPIPIWVTPTKQCSCSGIHKATPIWRHDAQFHPTAASQGHVCMLIVLEMQICPLPHHAQLHPCSCHSCRQTWKITTEHGAVRLWESVVACIQMVLNALNHLMHLSQPRLTVVM